MIAQGEENNILSVSNPAFELFLLLHFENAYEDEILPNVVNSHVNGKKINKHGHF